MTLWHRIRVLLAATTLLPVLAGPAAAQMGLRDPEIERWLYEMSEPLWEAANINEGSVEILLIGDPTPNAFAGASSGLKMGIHTGLITMAKMPNEIEGVIAHETGHLAGGHSFRTREALARAQRPALMSLVLGVALIAVGAPPEAGIGAIGLGQSVAIDNYLAYSRGQESAADQAAVTYLDEIGASTQGLIDFFDVLKNQQLIRASQPQGYAQTHPLAVQRVAKLRRRAEESPYWEVTDTEEEVFRLRMIQAKIHGYLNEPNVTLRMYPLSDQSMPAHYARAFAYYHQSDIEKGTREIEHLLSQDPDNPYFLELLGQMLFDHGKVEASIGPHRRTTEIMPDEPIFKINLARSLVTTEDAEYVEEAITALKEALLLDKESAFAWSTLARAQAYAGNEELAMLAQAEANYHVGNDIDAHRFASLAKEKLPRGTPEHQQALDIIVATAEAVDRSGRRVRRN